jgi:Na+-transporting NADH:ubiquinone oxidoreductase subunit F
MLMTNKIKDILNTMSFEVVLIAVIAFLILGLLLTALILATKAKLVSSDLCKITINEDSSKVLEVQASTLLLFALTQNDIAIPSPCGGKATCKQCKVQVTSDVGEPLEVDKGTFSNQELKSGWRLSCQCKVKQDMQVHLPEHLLSVKTFKGRVIFNQNVATYIKELIIEIAEEIPYKAGGYFQVHTPSFKTNTNDWKDQIDPKFHIDWEKFNLFGKEIDYSNLHEEVIRAYSMASYPAEGKKLIFNIRIATPPFVDGKVKIKLPWGICSSYIFSLKPGDEVKLSGPYGESFMINDGRELVFLIGGAGSSFSRSHILHLFHTEHTNRKVTLWYGARSLKENIYQKEYEELARERSNFDYRLVLSAPLEEDFQKGWPKDDPTKTNYLFKAFEIGQLSKMEEPEEALYYVCGPPLHNTSVLKLLDDYGVSKEHIVLDDFGN